MAKYLDENGLLYFWTQIKTKFAASAFSKVRVSNNGTNTDLEADSTAVNAGKILYVRIRDTAGKRDGYFYGSDTYFLNYIKANNSTSTLTYAPRAIHRYTGGSFYTYNGATTTGYGVYAYSLTSAGVLNIYRRYNSNYSLTIDGTYKVEAYLLDTPDGVSPFA